jgi:hypothetical protein
VTHTNKSPKYKTVIIELSRVYGWEVIIYRDKKHEILFTRYPQWQLSRNPGKKITTEKQLIGKVNENWQGDENVKANLFKFFKMARGRAEPKTVKYEWKVLLNTVEDVTHWHKNQDDEIDIMEMFNQKNGK